MFDRRGAEITIGAKGIYYFFTPKGYGITIPYIMEVVGLTKKRVKIKLFRKNGETDIKTVKPESLALSSIQRK